MLGTAPATVIQDYFRGKVWYDICCRGLDSCSAHSIGLSIYIFWSALLLLLIKTIV